MCLPIGLLGASDSAIPARMLGLWAHGPCSVASDQLFISAQTARLGTGKPAAIYYDPGEGGQGAAIHWQQEYVVDNFVYANALNAIVHNTQGFGMPGAVLYKKCPR